MRIIFPFIVLHMLFGALHSGGQMPLKTRDTSMQGPQTFAIIVGISKYKYVQPLTYADKDAELFRDYLKSPAGGSVKDENLFCLLNEKALNSNFWGKGFQWLRAKNLQKGDRLFIYLAGHGDAIDADQFFFLGYDCNPAGDKNNYLVSGTIQLYNLKKKIAAETQKGVDVFFIMDACRSNELPGGSMGQNFLNTAVSEKKAGEIIMLATGAGQESLEDASIGTGHGLFTYYLVEGLSGAADSANSPDRNISFREIELYVEKKVPEIAQQQFKKTQDPYFYCPQSNDKIISIVDTTWLKKWLQKKQGGKGPGNSIAVVKDRDAAIANVDTALIRTYNLFNLALTSLKLTGTSSAEFYYEEMNKKFGNNSYTLDAKSSLGVAFINLAQDKINQYLNCGDNLTVIQKQEFYESGRMMEKAITFFKEEEPEFANSLLGRMHFLKASGDFGVEGKNGSIALAFENAFRAYALDSSAAYINNRLATLHLENGNADSAVYYAQKSTHLAPKWQCAFLTLSKAKNALNRGAKTELDSTMQSKKREDKKAQFGVLIGSGVSKLKPNYTLSRNDTLIGVEARNIIKLDLGFFYQINLSEKISWRPSAIVSFEGGELTYEKRSSTTGGVSSFETIKKQIVSTNIYTPLVFSFSEKNWTPVLSIGPSFSYIVKENAAVRSKLPFKQADLQGNIGLATNFNIARAKLQLSPELKFSQGFLNINEDINNFYTHSIDNLKRKLISFSIYIKGN
jgi:hypothetical protein